ncbi:FAD-dependent oxidoreductase [Chitinivibrio alkaliphilus]|uniref:Dihydrolipoyl dehydrogenase n=1 Tax=Chitinivibrio alkaliphilus ACht1 TaxID=1313304 RepID=U7D8V6_9BACT|nr:FAD-dependent oxidoreductase [Chitinivibrio alkaliphilus]ERP31537.1 dihydrolipoamide dehydrogenase [Chitinivibrio alkaliphilus ACht1]
MAPFFSEKDPADLLILGAGPAGYTLALAAAERGNSVMLFTGGDLGGLCLNRGCIPSTTFLSYARTSLIAQNLGLPSHPLPDFSCPHERSNTILSQLRKGLEHRLKTAGVTLSNSRGEYLNESDKGVCVVTDTGNYYHGIHLAVATGSTLTIPFDTSKYTGYQPGESYFAPPPKNVGTQVVIAGASFAGLELAQIYTSLGYTVHVIEKSDTALACFDRPLRRRLFSALRAQNITISLSTEITAARNTSVTCIGPEGQTTVPADILLCCCGRTPSMDALRRLPPHSPLIAPHGQKNRESKIFLLGDVVGAEMTAHGAIADAETCAALLRDAPLPHYGYPIPKILYTTPEVFAVGLTQEEAQRRNISCYTRDIPLGHTGKFSAEFYPMSGTARAIFSENREEVLGIQMVGAGVSELCTAATMIVQLKIPPRQIQNLILPHPTMGEIFKPLLTP